jgi:hypothetical protein
MSVEKSGDHNPPGGEKEVEKVATEERRSNFADWRQYVEDGLQAVERLVHARQEIREIADLDANIKATEDKLKELNDFVDEKRNSEWWRGTYEERIHVVLSEFGEGYFTAFPGRYPALAELLLDHLSLKVNKSQSKHLQVEVTRLRQTVRNQDDRIGLSDDRIGLLEKMNAQKEFDLNLTILAQAFQAKVVQEVLGPSAIGLNFSSLLSRFHNGQLDEDEREKFFAIQKELGIRVNLLKDTVVEAIKTRNNTAHPPPDFNMLRWAWGILGFPEDAPEMVILNYTRDHCPEIFKKGTV